MAEPKKDFKLLPKENEEPCEPAKIFDGRDSNELVIAFAGPAGCGLTDAIEAAQQNIQEFGYKVEKIKVSEIIKNINLLELNNSKRAERYLKLQQAGSELRDKYGTDILSKAISTRIALLRQSASSENESQLPNPAIRRIAYLVDQLKHPDEVEFLRAVYRNLFYLVGVLSCEEKRKKRLIDEPMTENEAVTIMNTDKDEGIKHGQRLEDTLQLADLFIRNSSQNRLNIDNQIKRFLELLHGKIGLTPTQHEYAMYVAQSASLKSACLSRQVGTAITDSAGVILSTGCNDVPKFRGGLYTSADKENDHRCIHKANKCFNDHHKDLLRDEIKYILEDKKPADCTLSPGNAQLLANSIRKSTKMKDIIEYSRSVHAEMDAITAIARIGGKGTLGAYLYSTTFPCHNCARHIIAAGIERVYYIEPYEKSLAYTLHDDAIVIDPEKEDANTGRVAFLHFEGITPRSFQSFFHTGLPRKENGNGLPFYNSTAKKIASQYIDSYLDFERRALKDINDLGLKVAIIQ